MRRRRNFLWKIVVVVIKGYELERGLDIGNTALTRLRARVSKVFARFYFEETLF